MPDSSQTRAAPSLTAGLDALARRPLVLWLLCLALSALAQPYPGILHDARLYALQVLNQVEGGAFGHDLFLRYGSQDQFSVFSAVAAPLAAILGVPTTFFLLYLLSRALFLYGLMRFILELFGATRLGVVAVLVLAVDPVHFGGFGVFQVNESFLTPRLPACGLTLLGLAWMLRGHPLRAAGCFVLGCLLHPLMAIVGFPILLGWLVVTRWPERGLIGLTALAIVGCALVLGIPAVGYALFKRMDADWLEQVRLVTTYNFPLHWRTWDYLTLAMNVAVVGVTARLLVRTDLRRANFLGLVVLIALGGLLATTVSSVLGYRILFQGQPYRALWLLHLLAVPCGFTLVARAWATGSEGQRVAALLATASLACTADTWLQLFLPAVLFPILACGLRGLAALPRRPDWLSASVAGSLVAGLALWGVNCVVVLHALSEKMHGRFDDMEILFLTVLNLGVVTWALVSLGVVRWAAPALVAHPGRVALAALGCFLLLHAASFGVTQLPWYRQAHTRQGENVAFLTAALREHHPDGPPPTLYWTGGRMEVLWLQMRTSGYFNFLQMAGILYNRDTAAESFRRGRRVGAFEMARFRVVRDTFPDYWRAPLETLHGVKADEAEVTAEALRHLAADPLVDYVVADADLGGPCLATNGRVYLYDCRALRAVAAAR